LLGRLAGRRRRRLSAINTDVVSSRSCSVRRQEGGGRANSPSACIWTKLRPGLQQAWTRRIYDKNIAVASQNCRFDRLSCPRPSPRACNVHATGQSLLSSVKYENRMDGRPCPISFPGRFVTARCTSICGEDARRSKPTSAGVDT